jgi:CheY-like chemotaxis protein
VLIYLFLTINVSRLLSSTYEYASVSSHYTFILILTNLNIQMPILDGFGATREMREFEKLTGAKAKIIIGISACSEQRSKDEALASGINQNNFIMTVLSQ